MSNDVSLDINQESNPVQTVAPPKEDNNMLRATDKITALYCRLSVKKNGWLLYPLGIALSGSGNAR